MKPNEEPPDFREGRRAASGVCGIAEAIAMLRHARSDIEAEEAYWRIDNHVVVQGTLLHGVLSATADLVDSLEDCTNFARPRILDAIYEIAAGQPDPSEVEKSPNLKRECIDEICRGIPFFFELARRGLADERLACLEILGWCSDTRSEIRPELLEMLSNELKGELNSDRRALLVDWVEHLQKL